MIGTGLFGKVDQVPGRCYVATRFLYVGIPLIPLESWAVVEKKELVSVEFLVKTIAGVSVVTEDTPRGVQVPFSWRSVGVTYLRMVLWPLHGVAAAFSLIFLVMFAVVGRQAEKQPDDKWPYIMAGFVTVAILGGLCLWLSYRLTRATPRRASELFSLLRLKPPPPRVVGV